MTKTEERGSILDEYHLIFKPLPPTLTFILEMFEGCLIFTHTKVIKQKEILTCEQDSSSFMM